jgi:hypothetical protein
MGNTLVHLGRDGQALHRVDLVESNYVKLSPLATSAIFRHDGLVDHVSVTGSALASLGPTALPEQIGVMREAFSASGGALIVELGFINLDHQRTEAFEVRSPSGTTLRRFEDAELVFVGGDGALFVTVRGSEAVASDANGVEKWRVRYRSTFVDLTGSRNGRTVYLHGGPSGLLVVDGMPTEVPSLSTAAFSPDGAYVVSRLSTQVTLRANGAVAWETALGPYAAFPTIDVNDRGLVLLSVTPRTDGKASSVALLYDASGGIVVKCDTPGYFEAAFSRDGTAFGLYGEAGVALFELDG